MNTNLISTATTKSLPHYPSLKVGKTRRVFTKHFTNLPLWLSADEISLLSWLCYQSMADNTFKYSTDLLNKYKESVEYAKQEYSGGNPNMVLGSILNSRHVLKRLIEKGLIFQTGTKNKLMINPALTYPAEIINAKKYDEMSYLYQCTTVDNLHEFTDYYTNLVSSFLSQKKKNYKYGKTK
jgi:hypothetical protein